MYQIMRTFVESGYSNTMTLDHTPRFLEGYEAAGTAYAIGYMRALLQRALVERAEAELSTGQEIAVSGKATEPSRSIQQ
jgi:D-mannonate dehydratase